MNGIIIVRICSTFTFSFSHRFYEIKFLLFIIIISHLIILKFTLLVLISIELTMAYFGIHQEHHWLSCIYILCHKLSCNSILLIFKVQLYELPIYLSTIQNAIVNSVDWDVKTIFNLLTIKYCLIHLIVVASCISHKFHVFFLTKKLFLPANNTMALNQQCYVPTFPDFHLRGTSSVAQNFFSVQSLLQYKWNLYYGIYYIEIIVYQLQSLLKQKNSVMNRINYSLIIKGGSQFSNLWCPNRCRWWAKICQGRR